MRKKIDIQQLPKHIGIIMDGNGRWAKQRGLPRLLGHKAGVDAIKRVTEAAEELGIKVISYYAFSTENWKRNKEEVDGIFELVRNYLDKNKQSFSEKNIKIQTMGDITKLPDDLCKKLEDIVEQTKNHTGLIVNIGLNYGSRAEIVYAVNKLIKSGKTSITESDISNALYTGGLPDPDLIIRTSGEQRLSNFMLYQIAYSEFYFPNMHWPDFNKKLLEKAIIEYQSRNRRFGSVK